MLIRTLLFIAVFGATQLFAQMCPCEFGKDKNAPVYRNEIGYSILNVHEEFLNFYSPDVTLNYQVGTGLTYKYHKNHFSYRAAYQYASSDFHYKNDNPLNFNDNQGNSTHHEFRIGVEKTFNTSALQYYAGADLLFNKGQYRGVTEGYGDFQPYYKNDYSMKSIYAGFSPVVGLKYRFHKRFSITAEPGIQMVYYKTYDSNVYKPEKGIALLIQPLRTVSLNFNF